jgi:hypothetical protein
VGVSTASICAERTDPEAADLHLVIDAAEVLDNVAAREDAGGSVR